nr:hypothetical protein [Tanacetum cinerariifolium]
MGDTNPIHTLGDYSKPSHEGYRNTIELLEGNNVYKLRAGSLEVIPSLKEIKFKCFLLLESKLEEEKRVKDPNLLMERLPTDRVALDEYTRAWFHSEVFEAMEVRSMGISFRTELQEKIASRHHVIEHLEKVGATSGWLMRLNRDQEDDVLLLGLLDTFMHMMYEIVHKREKDVRELDY